MTVIDVFPTFCQETVKESGVFLCSSETLSQSSILTVKSANCHQKPSRCMTVNWSIWQDTFGMKNKITIVGPDEVKAQFAKMIASVGSMYMM